MAYSDEVLADSPTLYWKLDEASGSTAADSSGNSRNGTYPASGVTYGQPGLTGADSAVALTASAGISGAHPGTPVATGNYPHSVEFWVKTNQSGNTAHGTAPAIIARNDSSTLKHWVVSINSDGRLAVYRGDSYAKNVGTAVINDGQPHHIVLLNDSNTGGLTIYVDGAVDPLTTTANSITHSYGSAAALTVGVNPRDANTTKLTGTVDEVALYNGHLSSTRIAAHYAAAAPTPGGLIFTPGAASASGQAHVPVVGLGALELAPAPAAATATSHAPTVVVSGVAVAPPAASATAAAAVPMMTGQGAVVLPSDGLNLSAPTPIGSAVTLPPTAAPVPAGLTEWPVEVHPQPMPALTAATPRMSRLDYTAPDPTPYGRLAVFFDGVDVTHLRDVPAEILSWSSARPSGDTAARVAFPQIAPWDGFGTGDLAPFRKDAPVEIGIVRTDNSYGFLWEGFWSSEGDATGEAREATTLDCEGTFWQAAHTLHIPPLHLEPTDVGVLVARALNAVPGRRYAAIPEVATGILTRERGSQTQSVLAYVQDLLSTAWTDDGRQWTLSRVAPYTYRIQLTDIATVHGTITKGAPGVEVDLQRDESTRVDAVYARGVAPSGGVWANWFWPGLDLYTPPAYLYASPATNMTLGATDAGTLTGTGVSDWQRRVNELGYVITVDGTFSADDAQAARWVQQQRGITVDGVVGPQTWNATWDVGAQALDLTAIRLPLAAKDETEPYFYTANGAVAGENSAYNGGLVRRSIDVNFGADVSKTTARPLAQRYLDMYGTAAWTGRVTLSTDPHEGVSRLEYREGMNLVIVGHDGGDLLVQIADADHGPMSSTFVVDERARDAMTVDALLARDRDARRSPTSRPGNPTKLAQLDRNQIVQYEDESKAGVIPRVAINGSAGLWSVLPIFVSQTGSVAKMVAYSSPATPFCLAIFGRPITANQLAGFVVDPLVDGDGWRDHEETLLTRYGWVDTWGEPGQRAGFSPWQESDGRGVTGRLSDDAGFPFVSEVGGYLWVAIFAAADCFIEGRLFPGVPQ